MSGPLFFKGNHPESTKIPLFREPACESDFVRFGLLERLLNYNLHRFGGGRIRPPNAGHRQINCSQHARNRADPEKDLNLTLRVSVALNDMQAQEATCSKSSKI